ncbi:MAG: hypothetical protein WDO24_13910 [Pseudomonadota bacterium]
MLATRIDGAAVASESRIQPASTGLPDPAAIARAADILSAAKSPLIVTADIGETARGVAALAALATHHAIPVGAVPAALHVPAGRSCDACRL